MIWHGGKDRCRAVARRRFLSSPVCKPGIWGADALSWWRFALDGFCTRFRSASGFLPGVCRPRGIFPSGTRTMRTMRILTVILTNFARSQGLGASFSPGVVGKVSGRFDAVPPETFLKGMQAAFGVTWYRLGSTLYFYSESELSRTFITPRAMTAEASVPDAQAIGGVRPATARDARPRRRDDRRVRPAHLPCPDFSRRHRL